MSEIKFRLLTAREIECRIQQVKDKGLVLLLYKDARCDQNILDETVGPLNWQRQHSRENRNCTVSIWDEDKNQWVCKEDTGTESNTEAEKGLASDSFKRACVNWGIGRELYTAPFIWVSAADCNIVGTKCYDRFDVASIAYNDHREISGLEIVNEKTGKTVYRMGDKAPEPEMQPEPEQKRPEMFTCRKCGKVLQPYKGKTGAWISVREHAKITEERFGEPMCRDCCHKYYPDAFA